MKQNNTHLYFYGGVFSNWYGVKFIDPISQLTFSNTEQFFMFKKAEFFGDTETKIEISLTPNPADNKALGRKIKNYNDKAWEVVRYSMMVYANYLKYTQDAECKKALLDTGHLSLVEASPYDGIWGIKLSVEDAIAGKPWNGQNLLGQVLMMIREELQAEEIKRFREISENQT